MVGILKGLLSTVTPRSLSSPRLWKEYGYFHLATFESYSDFLYIFHDKGIQPILKHTRYNFKMCIEPSIEFREYQLLLGPTSMISLISHSFSSLSSFRCAVPTSLSLLKKDLGRQEAAED